MGNLLLGIDLGKYHSQISVYDEKKRDIVSISPYPSEDEGLIPTVLGVTVDKKRWLYGRECADFDGERVDNILDIIEKGENITILGVEFTGQRILKKYLKKLLLLVRTHYPVDTIAKLVITVEKKTTQIEEAVYLALEDLGIGKDRALLCSYEESYITYVLSQKKELWARDVALFDFNEKGLYYKQLSFNRENKPMALYIFKKDYSESLRYEWLDNRMEREKMSYLFLNLAKESLHKQNISTIYVIGTGFRDSFVNEVLPELCIGHRVFMGNNLYVQGACYKAMELEGKRPIEPYIFMGEDMISYHVYVPVYKNANDDYAVLSKFGSPWKECQKEIEVILDDEEEVRIVVNYPLKKEDKMFIIPLEGLPKRPAKMTRLSISIEFFSEDEFVVRIKDMGFGSFYKSTNRIWEKRIKL